MAAEEDQARSGALAVESERKLTAMRDRSARAEQAEHDAALSAQAAADAAYEAQWRDSKAQGSSKRDDTDYTVQSLSQVPTRPELELAAVAPPKGEIVAPRVEIEHNAVIPRPFHNSDDTVRR